MIEYKSTKSMPYVYMGTHRITNEIYIGYREKHTQNNVPSSDDLGNRYFTSGKISKAQFAEFNWTIIAEFFDPIDAYWYEQELIESLWTNPLLLNARYQCRKTSSGVFRFAGKHHSEKTKLAKSVPLTDEIKAKISKKVRGENHPNFGKKLSAETCKKISESSVRLKGEDHPQFGIPRSEEVKQKISNKLKGVPLSDETKLRMKIAAKKKLPQTEETKLKRSEALKLYWKNKSHSDS